MAPRVGLPPPPALAQLGPRSGDDRQLAMAPLGGGEEIELWATPAADG